MLEFQQFYWRNLPHIQPPGATMFVMSLREGAEQAYIDTKKFFGRWDAALGTIYDTSPRCLEHDKVAEIVCEALNFLGGKF